MVTKSSLKSAPAKRALSHVGGADRRWGAKEQSALLSEAFAVPNALEDDDSARSNIHGFHAYPARLHPVTASRLIEGFSKKNDTVLDPFCGSGTVLVEGRRLGRKVIGVDANPLAVDLARLKTRSYTKEESALILAEAKKIAGAAEERRLRQAGATRRYDRHDTQWFSPHMLMELDGLYAGIKLVENDLLQQTLQMIFSSILTKMSKRASDTSARTTAKRLKAGFAIEFFVKRTEEMLRQAAEAATLYGKSPPSVLFVGDARTLAPLRLQSVDLIVTSPPYPGNYDYLSHHDTRLRWLQYGLRQFDQMEIGSRRKLEPLGPNARQVWIKDLSKVLCALRRVLKRSGRLALIMADSVVGNDALYVLDALDEVITEAGFELEAGVAQARPHFHKATAGAFKKRPREEHIILLCPV